MSTYEAQVIQVTNKSKDPSQRLLFILVLNIADLSLHQSFLKSGPHVTGLSLLDQYLLIV